MSKFIHFLKTNYLLILTLLIAIILMFFAFYKSPFISSSYNFSIIPEVNYDDSEILIRDYGYALSKGYDVGVYGYGRIESDVFIGCKSTFALQGRIFGFLYNSLHISYDFMNALMVLLLTIAIIVICFLLSKKYNLLLGICFYFVCLFSTFLTMFAKNLFFMPVQWFLPLLITLILFDHLDSKIYITICNVLLFLSILTKCLSNYEYISTVLVFAFAFPFADLVSAERGKRKRILMNLLISAGVCIVAFICAVLIHATIRGSNIAEGIKNIWIEDVLRRSYGDDVNYSQVYSDSLNASVFDVLITYMFNWRIPVFSNFNLKFSIIFTFASILAFLSIIIFAVERKHKNLFMYSILYFVMIVGATSWFVLMKAHSYIHTHMNFVVWSLGYLQVAIYLILYTTISFFDKNHNSIFFKKVIFNKSDLKHKPLLYLE